MFSVVECLECRWCLSTEMRSVAFLCHKSAQLFLGPVQSWVCAASSAESTLRTSAAVGTHPSPPASLGFRQMSRGRRALLTLRSFWSLCGQSIPVSIQVPAHTHCGISISFQAFCKWKESFWFMITQKMLHRLCHLTVVGKVVGAITQFDPLYQWCCWDVAKVWVKMGPPECCCSGASCNNQRLTLEH